ncbi:LysR family transcriptional regulator ArgP [Desulfobotulus sp.]|jgi:LysR family transcriptional regulator (chromosome initiation inhibitor)|uniref:LysR family transcriptional regulator ArgP n=1 Tax=Desulfobotulus sp. TaxID=1940337 RepID=UPI002A36DB52|nr:LysR family transcriptional regulator ArgP [Desulfobotulus sp.]MDY0161700.1 LysR family transcriptional regulator ArgP [Desulfobotulus sp.]
MLDYKLLEALARVLEEGGFERAAQALCITQSAVSQRIKLLESQVGQVLLVRSTPPRATVAGLGLLKHYRQVACLEADLESALLPQGPEGFRTLKVGLNADSLITWFPGAVKNFLLSGKVLLDLFTDDQDVTHRLLQDGEVMGCITSRDKGLQGCRIHPLGSMRYRMLASPAYMKRWLPQGVSGLKDFGGPVLIFNRKDRLQDRFFSAVLGFFPSPPLHYVPSATSFQTFALLGLGCGMIPDLQSRDLRCSGALVEVVPDMPMDVPLYWHCWDLDSALLTTFTDMLVREAGKCLL